MHRWLVVLALAAWGCGKGEREAPEHDRAPDLQIVSAGSEPRRVLRYALAKGTTQKLELAIDVRVEANEMGGAMPTMVLDLSLAVEDLVPYGAKLRATVDEATARDRDETRVAVQALARPLELMKGLAFTATLTPSGRVVGSTIELGDKEMAGRDKAQLASLASSFENLLIPLPETAVGVGAVWRTSRPIEQNGMKLTAVSSVKVTALEGDKLSYELETSIHGADQTVTQEGLRIDIEDITGVGRGKGTLDLSSLVVDSELTSELRNTMQASGESAPTRMKMEIATRVTPR